LPDRSIIFARWRQQHKNGGITLGFATHFSCCHAYSSWERLFAIQRILAKDKIHQIDHKLNLRKFTVTITGPLL